MAEKGDDGEVRFGGEERGGSKSSKGSSSKTGPEARCFHEDQEDAGGAERLVASIF